MQKRKWIAGGLLLALAVFVFFQNREVVETRFLFFTVSSSRAAALSLAFLAGLLVGGLLFGLRRRRPST